MNNRKDIAIIITAIIILFSPVAQATEKNDTVYSQKATPTSFKAKQLILPGALIALGASSFFIDPVRDFDHSLQKRVTDLRGSHHRIKLDEFLRYVPTATSVSLSLAKHKSNVSSIDGYMAFFNSYAVLYTITQGLKHIVHRTRPDGSDDHSFPSGHVASTFLSAEMLRIEHGNLWGAVGYTAATGVAFLRLYNNRHWFSDIIGGAGIAILSARISYWLIPFEKKLFGINNGKRTSNKSIVALPAYDSGNNSLGIALAVQF